MNHGGAKPLRNSSAGGLITWTRVGGGSRDWAWALGSIWTFHDKPTPSQDMTAARRFSGPALEELAKAKSLGVRAGAEHCYTGVWVVEAGVGRRGSSGWIGWQTRSDLDDTQLPFPSGANDPW